MSQANVRSFRDILVYLSAGEGAPARLAAAIALAQQHDARLIGVEVNSVAVYSSLFAAEATQIEERFRLAARAAKLDHVFHVATREDTAGWNALYSHYADIVVAPAASEADAGLVLRGMPEDVLLNGGVPVLIIPEAWREQPLGRRVMVSWNASREATRAVHDALPILTRAEQVSIFAFDSRQKVLRAEIDLLESHLAAHGIAAKCVGWPDSGELEPVDALFSSLSDEGADMIVAGGYGHPRLIERLLGGVSRTLARTLTVPVLMSH